jgi:type I restriction enzyme R subunit
MSESNDSMSDGLSEQTNEHSLLRWLDQLGWTTYGGQKDHGSGGPLINDKYDRSIEEPILWSVVREKAIALNPKVTESNVDSVITGIKGDLAGAQSLLETNKVAHNLLTTGRQTTLQQPDKEPITTNVTLVDFDRIPRNSLIAANQVRFRNNGRSIRPDITLFLNGFPIVQGELKSSAQGNRIGNAIRDLKSYEGTAPRAFETGLFNFAAETHEYHVGAVGTPSGEYQPWNRAPPEYTTSEDIEKFKQGARATLNPATLLDILENYVFFQETGDGLVKITPRYMQYYAVQKIVSRVQSDERTRGLIWHTQGSGKSFSMLYAANRLLEADWFPSPQILILVDTDDLREQLSTTLNQIGYSHRFEVAGSMDHLYDMLRSGTSKVILTTVQMFEEAPQDIQGNENTVLLSDEAHRFMEKRLGNRLDGALPDAHHYGFTGTPVSSRVRNTFNNFSNGTDSNGGQAYLDHYSIKDGIDDGVILPVHFEVRTDVGWSVNDIDLDEQFQEITEDLTDEEKRDVVRETVTSQQLGELPTRVQALTEDIYNHYQQKLAPNDWKGMVVTPSRKSAVMYGEALRELVDDPDDVRVIISEDPDAEIESDAIVAEGKQSNLIRSFKRDESPRILVVCDMLLTGFDAPVLKGMYLDRNLKDHNLLQAIARVNRPEQGKNNGLIVDYRGALSNLEEALEFDDEVIQEEIVAEEDELLDHFEELLQECRDMFSSDLHVESQEEITELVSEVAKSSERYKEKVARLQNIYESLSPHGGLVEYGDTYQSLNRIRLELESIEESPDGPTTTDQEWGQKTRDLLEETTDFETVGQEYPEFELDSTSLGEISDVPPEIEVIRVGKGLQEIVERKRQENPRYEQLSERLQNVLEQWQEDMIDAAKALSTLERIEDHTRELEENAENPELNNAEYAIYLTLRDEYEDHVHNEDAAELLAKEIEMQFQENVNRDFVGWKTNPDTHKEIRSAIITALQECNELALYSEGVFVDACVQYLIENHD